MARYEGRMLIVDTVMPNGYIYPKGVVEDALKDFNERLKTGEVYGGFGDQDRMFIGITPLKDITHKVNDIYVSNNGEVWGKIETVPTENGKIADKVISCCDLALRAVGKVNDDNTVTDLNIISVDIVPGSSNEIIQTKDNV